MLFVREKTSIKASTCSLSNLLVHDQRVHPAEEQAYNELHHQTSNRPRKTKRTVEESQDCQKQLKTDKFTSISSSLVTQEMLNQAVTDFIVMDSMPFTIVEVSKVLLVWAFGEENSNLPYFDEGI